MVDQESSFTKNRQTNLRTYKRYLAVNTIIPALLGELLGIVWFSGMKTMVLSLGLFPLIFAFLAGIVGRAISISVLTRTEPSYAGKREEEVVGDWEANRQTDGEYYESKPYEPGPPIGQKIYDYIYLTFILVIGVPTILATLEGIFSFTSVTPASTKIFFYTGAGVELLIFIGLMFLTLRSLKTQNILSLEKGEYFKLYSDHIILMPTGENISFSDIKQIRIQKDMQSPKPGPTPPSLKLIFTFKDGPQKAYSCTDPNPPLSNLSIFSFPSLLRSLGFIKIGPDTLAYSASRTIPPASTEIVTQKNADVSAQISGSDNNLPIKLNSRVYIIPALFYILLICLIIYMYLAINFPSYYI